MSAHDIDNHLTVLEDAIVRQDKKLAIKIGLRLLGVFLKTLLRIAEALDHRVG